MTRRFAFFAVAISLWLTLAPDGDAYWRARYGYNPCTRRAAYGYPTYNPYVGYHAGYRGYNPYTGRDYASRSYYNPYTGNYGHVAGAYNPYTGRYAYRYGVY